MTVVVTAEDARSAGEVAEVPRRELPTTDLAATSMSADASDVPRADVSTASGTPGVPAAGAGTPRVSAARGPAAVSHGERHAGVEGEREDDRDAKGEEGTPERAQRPLHSRELHGRKSGRLVREGQAQCRRAPLLLPRFGLRRSYRKCREPEQADDLHDEEREALISSQPCRGCHVDHGLADASEDVDGGEAIERVPGHAAHRRYQHDACEERQVLQGVQVGAVEAPDEAAIIGNPEVSNGTPGGRCRRRTTLSPTTRATVQITNATRHQSGTVIGCGRMGPPRLRRYAGRRADAKGALPRRRDRHHRSCGRCDSAGWRRG